MFGMIITNQPRIGKALAIAGSIVQALALVVVIKPFAKVYDDIQIMAEETVMSGSADLNSITVEITKAAAPLYEVAWLFLTITFIGIGMMVAGLFFRYRAAWFYWSHLFTGCLLLLGNWMTILLGLFCLGYCLRYRDEFIGANTTSNLPPPLPPKDRPSA
jgi:hypothetical protein